MSTRFVSKRQSIVPGSCFSGEWQGISVLESGLVKAKLELLPDSSLTERELQQRDYEQGYNATKRHKDQRSRFHMYITAGVGGSFKGDSKPCLHYLATCQLLPQASASAPPSMLLRIRKAFCSRLAERPKKRLCCFAAHPTNRYSLSVQQHLVSICPRRRVPNQNVI